MEKRKPHYNLNRVCELIEQRKFTITRTATSNALEDFGIYPDELPEIIKQLDPREFYKSMTSNTNSQIWQDVYHKKMTLTRTAYIKIQIVNESTVLIQFKEK